MNILIDTVLKSFKKAEHTNAISNDDFIIERNIEESLYCPIKFENNKYYRIMILRGNIEINEDSIGGFASEVYHYKTGGTGFHSDDITLYFSKDFIKKHNIREGEIFTLEFLNTSQS